MKKYITKTILSKNTINLYDEFNHDSIYEVPTSESREYDDQLDKIRVDLSKKKIRHMIHTGISCNAYPNIEEQLCVTKELLNIAYDYAYGVSIFSKSNLIIRDLDLLQKINDQKRVVVMIPLTTLNDSDSKLIEPNSATTKERFNILAECNKRGIDTVVWINPILPYINDTVDNIKGILSNCKKTGVKAIVTFGLALKLEDRNREFFFSNIHKNFPSVRDKYLEQFSEDTSISTPRNITLENIIFKFCLDNNIIYGPDKVFEFINHFPERESLFDFEF